MERIQPRPQAFGVDPRDTQSLAEHVRNFRERFDIATCDATRTNPAITEKTIARNAAVSAVQRLVRVIKANPLTTEADLLTLGLRAPRQRRHEVPPPATSPLLSVIAGVDGVHKLRFADSLTPDSRRKPDGVIQMQLYVATAKETVFDPAAATFYGLITKCPFDVRHEPANNGKMATYFGRWSTRTGLAGPWSIPVGMTITFVQRGGGG